MLSVRTFAASAALFALVASSASAHAVLDKTQATLGRTYRGAITITHGCNGSPTTAVRVTIPDGLVLAKPMPKAGWTVTTVKGPYARAYAAFHGKVLSGVQEISWSGGPPLPDDQFDDFVFSGLVSDAFQEGDVIHVPVIQECTAGVNRWVEKPGPGRSLHDLASPAPSITIVAADDRPAPASPTFTAGALRIDAPTIRATPKGAKVAAGYLRITNTGTALDTLVGVSVPFAERGEVHEMSMADGIMKMRPLTSGLTIPPGQTVDLKPGGYHLMFQDVTDGPKKGETVAGTLHFAKAGDVPVTFTVTGLGGPGAGSGGMPMGGMH